ncbi:hypothetical protein GCM10022223_43480 [Kineosporia mesophila]|uniref:TetR family transcriptional regulator n=1 Tax=Kineosporia mesophila TaxID=566012 RepID=A0ABP6ZYM7_9ACTN|nr:hypothetical protein [Kineosporia mesophila]MCD5353223.1 hypothetical protein [Kineosporia mesophila]
MRIDPAIEPRVREAFAASVAEQPERFDEAIRALGDNDDDLRRALELAFNVVAAAAFAIDGGLAPTEERLTYFAEAFSKTQSSWSGVDQAAALSFLRAVTSGQDPLEVMTAGDAAYTAHALGGWLLSAFPRGEGLRWVDFLDGVLNGLEARDQ